LLTFLQDLLEHGHVRVPLIAEPIDPADKDIASAIRSLDAETRADLAGDAPPLSLPTTTWAFALLENACRYLVYREYEVEDIAAAFAERCPEPPSPSACYSADLFLRYLPDVTRLARGVGEADPLVEYLLAVARTWPLSSIGVEGIEIEDAALQPILSHPTLLQLYVDRIIERNDASRRGNETVREAIRYALGAHDHLAPQIAKAIGHVVQTTAK